jgi:hypothetical protein
VSGFKGVSPHKKRWIAQIECDGKHYYLGLFKDATSAAFEHDKAAIKLHGEFAVLNFPERRAEHQTPYPA